MRIVKKVSEIVTILSIMVALLFGCCLDSEGWWAPKGLACTLCVIFITEVINIYLKEVTE